MCRRSPEKNWRSDCPNLRAAVRERRKFIWQKRQPKGVRSWPLSFARPHRPRRNVYAKTVFTALPRALLYLRTKRSGAKGSGRFFQGTVGRLSYGERDCCARKELCRGKRPAAGWCWNGSSRGPRNSSSLKANIAKGTGAVPQDRPLICDSTKLQTGCSAPGTLLDPNSSNSDHDLFFG